MNEISVIIFFKRLEGDPPPFHQMRAQLESTIYEIASAPPPDTSPRAMKNDVYKICRGFYDNTPKWLRQCPQIP